MARKGAISTKQNAWVKSKNFLKFLGIPKFVPKFRSQMGENRSQMGEGDILSSERSPRGNAFSGHPERSERAQHDWIL